MNEVKYLWTEVDWKSFLITALIILVAFQYLTDKFEWFNKKFGFKSRKVLAKEKESQQIADNTLRIEEISRKLEAFTAESEKRDKIIKEKFNVLTQMFLEMQNHFLEMQEKSDASERYQIKDKLARSYNYHKRIGRWTKMDKEAFLGLIKDYEAHGGENSFVHSVCEPECYTWELID